VFDSVLYDFFLLLLVIIILRFRLGLIGSSFFFLFNTGWYLLLYETDA
jgi:hypothetical protein